MGKILHIEDNAENRHLVYRLLDGQGHQVIEAEDGLSGVRIARRELPDLILMDINLPGIDGHQATTLIRGIPGLETVPIVAITSNVMPGAREEALVAGCDGYMSKPIDVDRFLVLIEEFLHGRQEALDPSVRAEYLTKYSRKLAESLEAHTYARAFLEGIITQNPLSTLVTDTSGLCLMHNAAFVHLFNHQSPGGLVGRYNFLDDPALQAPPYRREALHLYDHGERIEFIVSYPVPGKGQRSLRIFGFPIMDATGKIGNVVIQHEDVTEELRGIEEQQRLSEQLFQARRMESVAAMSGGVARDFDSLLVGVLGSVELLLKNTGPDDASRRLLTIVRDSALRMSDLTQNLRAYSERPGSAPEPVDVHTFITDMLSFLKRLAGPRLEVRVSVPAGLPSIWADRNHLQQVLMHVVTKAAEAASGRGVVHLSATGPIPDQIPETEGGAPKNFVVLRIQDDGPGMSDEVLEHVFDPFFTTREMGRGLGMSAVLGIVTNHGGRINLQSRPAGGTTVEIQWPTAVLERNGADNGLSGGGATILIVDEDAIVRDLAREVLAGLGHTVIEARTADEGIDILPANPEIRLLILAHATGGTQASGFISRFREMNPDVKVIMAGGFPGEGPPGEAGPDAPDGFLQKPFQIGDLVAVVEQALGRRHGHQDHPMGRN